MRSLSRVRLFVTPWTVAYSTPPSMGFSMQEYWNGLPFPSAEDLPNPGIKPRSPTLQADSLPSKPPGVPGVFCVCMCVYRRRHWHPTPALLPGKSHGWRSPVGCSSWGRKESDTTERPHFHFHFPARRKCEVLTTGPAGNSPVCLSLQAIIYYFSCMLVMP